jgi:hypothetical protein
MRVFAPRVRSFGLKLLVFCAAGCGACVALVTWLRPSQHKITDQELLREAVAEWKRAGEPDPGPNDQIFEQQAAQGYYDDAAVTGRLFKRPEDVQWSVVELAKIRTENGDVPGAKTVIKQFAGSSLGARATRAIALAQVNCGDLQGALETAAEGGEDSDEILSAFAGRQIANGDFTGALKTAEVLKPSSADQVFYAVGSGLRARGEQNRVHELASSMSDGKLAAEFKRFVRFTLWNPAPVRVIEATPCDIAIADALHGKFAEADVLIEQEKCAGAVSYVAIRQYAIDPVGAEHLLRSSSDPQDLLYGFEQLSEQAAKKGDIEEALRFLNDLQDVAEVGGAGNQVLAKARTAQAVHEIARAWTIKDGPNLVLKWARSRPTTGDRTWALIGMAEALGHARPRQPSQSAANSK